MQRRADDDDEAGVFDEDFQTAWRMRFGEQAQIPPALPQIQRLLSHRSVRDFDTARPLPESTMAALVGAAQSAATSSNLQLYSLVSVQDAQRREQIAELCGGQQQIRDASWFFAVCVDHHRLREAADAAGEEPRGLDYIESFIVGVVDAALAAERMVCAAEALGIGICYIGALRNNAQAVSELLALPPRVFGLFGLCLGYPRADSTAAVKPRLAPADIWFRETYNQAVTVSEYDERMREFYESQQMKGSVTWSMRSGRRVNGKHLHGREVLKTFFEEHGFNQH
jgi:nitroreductase